MKPASQGSLVDHEGDSIILWSIPSGYNDRSGIGEKGSSEAIVSCQIYALIDLVLILGQWSEECCVCEYYEHNKFSSINW